MAPLSPSRSGPLTPPPGCPRPSPSPARRLIAWPSSVAGAPLTDFVSFMGQIHWTPDGVPWEEFEEEKRRVAEPGSAGGRSAR